MKTAVSCVCVTVYFLFLLGLRLESFQFNFHLIDGRHSGYYRLSQWSLWRATMNIEHVSAWHKCGWVLYRHNIHTYTNICMWCTSIYCVLCDIYQPTTGGAINNLKMSFYPLLYNWTYYSFFLFCNMENKTGATLMQKKNLLTTRVYFDRIGTWAASTYLTKTYSTYLPAYVNSHNSSKLQMDFLLPILADIILRSNTFNT